MLDQRWPRWIKASVYKHFKDLATILNIPVYLEAEPNRKTNKLTSFLEVRMDGPWIREISKDSFKVEVEINVLVQTQQVVLTAQGNDIYTGDRLIGQVATMFTESICLYKLGAGIGDDQSLLDSLNLDTSDRGKGILIHQFGLLQAALPVVQDTVEGRYFTRLKGI